MEEYDLLIIADATASMSNYLDSLNTSLPQIISISALTGCFSRVGLLAYRDYCDTDLLEWSGWLNQTATMARSLDASAGGGDGGDDYLGAIKTVLTKEQNEPDLVTVAQDLDASGGGDYPEAVKTALAKAYEVMRSDAKTIILLYTDAPPHMEYSSGGNGESERLALSKQTAYGGFGPAFVDWVSASHTLRSGEKQAQVFAILDSNMPLQYGSFYNFLCTLTGGACVYLRDSFPESISKVTVDMLLAWMGVEKAGKGTDQTLPADLSRYIAINGIKKVNDEKEGRSHSFFSYYRAFAVSDNIAKTALNIDVMKRYLPKKSTPVLDFAKRWHTDAQYKEVAVKHLMRIIEQDVRAIALNPVFGSLWRAICGDRNYTRRDEILVAFNHSLEQMTDAKEKAEMKAWLEQSYDYTAEVLSIIDGVPEAERFPCIFLDPTLNFSQLDADETDEDNRPITEFTRGELLEIGRSCNPSILRRLAGILTRLTIVQCANEMPEHIAMTANEQVPRFPLALATEKYGYQFWKILFHAIVPGTRLSARPAALVAALSLRLGITPLAEAAEREVMGFKNKWNDLEIPENWTVGCMTLLLDANGVYQKQFASLEKDVAKKPPTLLKPTDSALFAQLIAFKMLEINLDTPLTARVPWTPQKTMVSIGPLTTCRLCRYPRSVTVMGSNGKCGVCLAPNRKNAEERQIRIEERVTKETTAVSQATWVECQVPFCRAQYVVYHVEGLNVRAKCHYCRFESSAEGIKQKSSAPVVECKQCLNRIIWPKAYRPSSFVDTEFVCPPCTSGHQSTTDLETTARKIAVENTLSWLISDAQNAAELFSNRSLFHTITTMGADKFLSRINLFPSIEPSLSHKGKPIRNTATLVSTLQDLVASRKTTQVECSLCFSAFHPTTLNPACGRRGCLQRICTSCLKGWYGLNTPGCIINTAALACPFCRRFPTARTLSKYGTGIHSVKSLSDTVRDKGTWIYAWCGGCSSAKQYMERNCARGTPPEVTNWMCVECEEDIDVREGQRLEYERQQAEQVLADARRAQYVQRVEEAERRHRLAIEALESADAQRKTRIKPCPRCGTASEKAFGCGHVTCPMRNCRVHWCFFCGKQFDEDVIYKHMRLEHGGVYEDDDDEEYDSD